VIAALFVDRRGPYARDAFDWWDVARDARLYDGPHRVIAHPPCKRWGRYWSGGPSAKVRRKLGDDSGCFASALASVRRWGGVLEHPEASHAFATHGLVRPPRTGGWVASGEGGWVCCVEQGHYGHAARKATWLFVYTGGVAPGNLRWGPSSGKVRLDPGFHSAAERAAASPERRKIKRLTERERIETPVPFVKLLTRLASLQPLD